MASLIPVVPPTLPVDDLLRVAGRSGGGEGPQARRGPPLEAEAVARVIIEEFEVPWVKVSVAKPEAIRGSQEVGITIERTPEDYVD